MDTHTLLLIVLGSLLSFIGGIMMLIAAFRKNVWWGLASLFLPFANLVFAFLHWAEAKRGFFLMLAGFVAAGIGLATSPTLRAVAAQARSMDPAKLRAAAFRFESATPAPDLGTQIQQQRDRIEQLEAKFTTDGTALVQRFTKLTEQRKALKAGDAAAVDAFNVEAADYKAANTTRQQARKEINDLRAELDTLNQQRSRRSAAAAAGKRVVMYSTEKCGACKMAKAYLNKKGVAYEVRDLNSSPEAQAEFQKLGGRGVPLILIGEERMEGFNSQRLDQLL